MLLVRLWRSRTGGGDHRWTSPRTTLTAKLVEHAQQGDTRAILTLGHLKATEALPPLHAAAKSQDPWTSSARRALVLLGKGADVLAEIANDALHAPARIGRVAAVMDLSKIGGAVALAALHEALADEDSDVRVVVWDALTMRSASRSGSRTSKACDS